MSKTFFCALWHAELRIDSSDHQAKSGTDKILKESFFREIDAHERKESAVASHPSPPVGSGRGTSTKEMG